MMSSRSRTRILGILAALALVGALLPTSVLAVGYRVSGTITDAAGTPLSGILVSAFTTSAPVDGDVTVTAGDGSYQIVGLATGSYRVQVADPSGVRPSGYYAVTGFTVDAAAASPVVIGSADVGGINVKLPGAAVTYRLSGTVTDVGGSPLAGILVSAFTITGPPSGDVAVTGSDGRYAINGLAAGSYRVQFADPTGARPSGYYASGGLVLEATAASPVVIGSADVAGINVKLPGNRISGTITDAAGTPLAGILVSAFTVNAPVVGEVTVTAANGTFGIGGLAAGSYRVQVADPAGIRSNGYYAVTGFTVDADAATLVVIGAVDVGGINVKLPIAGAAPGPVPSPAPTKLSTPIKAGIHLGTSHAGTFVSGRTVVVRSGQYVTARFYLGKALAGKVIRVLASTKDSSGHWKPYLAVTTRRVDVNGYAYYSPRVRGWRAFRAQYAGDATHKASLSPAVATRGR